MVVAREVEVAERQGKGMFGVGKKGIGAELEKVHTGRWDGMRGGGMDRRVSYSVCVCVGERGL